MQEGDVFNVNKRSHNNGLMVAESLFKLEALHNVKNKECITVPLVILNPLNNELMLKENSIISEAVLLQNEEVDYEILMGAINECIMKSDFNQGDLNNSSDNFEVQEIKIASENSRGNLSRNNVSTTAPEASSEGGKIPSIKQSKIKINGQVLKHQKYHVMCQLK